MITSSQEYERFLANLSDTTPPSLKMRLPANEPIYEIDWNTRKINAPSFIGVQGDHEAEFIYFIMDRYFDAIDLSETIGLVTFRNAGGEEYYYVIPVYDIYSMSEENNQKIIFPWVIQAPVALYEGDVYFSFKFFKIDPTSKRLLYELNTSVAKTKVLVGWDSVSEKKYSFDTFDPQSLITDSELIDKLNMILSAAKYEEIYWTDV